MAEGLTAKQEGFVLDVFKQGTLADAYRNNYNTSNMTDKSVWELSSRLMADIKVSSRLSELQQEAAGRAQVTVASITKELEEARGLAQKEAQTSSMVSASMGKAKVNGLLVGKVEAKVEAEVLVTSPSAKLTGFLDVIAKRGGETSEPS